MLDMLKKIKFKLTHNCGGGVFVEYIQSPDCTKHWKSDTAKNVVNLLRLYMQIEI